MQAGWMDLMPYYSGLAAISAFDTQARGRHPFGMSSEIIFEVTEAEEGGY